VANGHENPVQLDFALLTGLGVLPADTVTTFSGERISSTTYGVTNSTFSWPRAIDLFLDARNRPRWIRYTRLA